jgi:hypothetical protein
VEDNLVIAPGLPEERTRIERAAHISGNLRNACDSVDRVKHALLLRVASRNQNVEIGTVFMVREYEGSHR